MWMMRGCNGLLYWGPKPKPKRDMAQSVLHSSLALPISQYPALQFLYFLSLNVSSGRAFKSSVKQLWCDVLCWRTQKNWTGWEWWHSLYRWGEWGSCVHMFPHPSTKSCWDPKECFLVIVKITTVVCLNRFISQSGSHKNNIVKMRMMRMMTIGEG